MISVGDSSILTVMNSLTGQALLPQQPHRSSFSCDRHPSEQYNGFCPICLCERLSTLDINKSSGSSSSRRPSNATASANSSAAAALKSIFRVSGPESSVNGNGGIRGRNKASAAFLPELRRTKSFSASKNERFPGIFEPKRKSCDVRTRNNTLWNLFNQNDERKFASRVDQTVEVVGLVNEPVLELREEEEEEEEEEEDHKEIEEDSSNGDEIRVLEETNVVVEEAVEEEIVVVSTEQVKTIKDHIDLDSQTTKKPSGMDLKEIAGSFWAAASVFSKKWHKWRQKQKVKKRNADVSSVALPVEKPISRQFYETQSEIADYGFGRRSCDTDPRFSLDAGRFSLDAGRMSFEDSRHSFDEPRASWDGHLIGRTFPRLPPMLSVVEDSPMVQVISRSDTQIPLEEALNYIQEIDETVPGGTAQTREYYDSTSRRRKSLDRSSSIRKTAAAVIAEIDEMKAAAAAVASAGGVSIAPNAKVTPSTVDYFPPPAAAAGGNEEREYNREWNSEAFRDNEVSEKGLKKSKKWMKALNIWGLFIQRRNKDSRNGVVERSFSTSWSELRREVGNGESQSGVVRSRDAYNLGSSFGSIRNKKRGGEMVVERNNSSRREAVKNSYSHSIARNVLQLY